MAGIRDFLRNRHGGMVERVAVMAGALALASMSGAHFLNVATRDGNSAIYALFRKNPGVDYTPTATVRTQAGQTSLDPCSVKIR